MRNVKNHSIKYKFKIFGDFYYNKNFIAFKKFADRVDILYTKDVKNLTTEITEDSEQIFFDFDMGLEGVLISKLKFIYLELKNETTGEVTRKPMWCTEHDNPTVRHFFDSVPLGWFLYRLTEEEKGLVYCGLRKLLDVAILYIYYLGKPIFCISESTVDLEPDQEKRKGVYKA